jgi:hypothetical protein
MKTHAMRVVVNSAEINKLLCVPPASLVLLKNEKSVLPLTKQIKSIAVVGPNADDQTLLTIVMGLQRYKVSRLGKAFRICWAVQ